MGDYLQIGPLCDGIQFDGLWLHVGQIVTARECSWCDGFQLMGCTGRWTTYHICITSLFFLWVAGVEVVITWIKLNECRPWLEGLWDTIMAVDSFHTAPFFVKSFDTYVEWKRIHAFIHEIIKYESFTPVTDSTCMCNAKHYLVIDWVK